MRALKAVMQLAHVVNDGRAVHINMACRCVANIEQSRGRRGRSEEHERVFHGRRVAEVQRQSPTKCDTDINGTPCCRASADKAAYLSRDPNHMVVHDMYMYM